MKASDIFLLVFEYTAFWSFFVWFLIGATTAALWYFLRLLFKSKNDEDQNR